jgi:hypothetical protein
VKKKSGRFVGSKLFWGLITSAVALGSTAAYFKIKADKNYDKYLDTGDIRIFSIKPIDKICSAVYLSERFS